MDHIYQHDLMMVIKVRWGTCVIKSLRALLTKKVIFSIPSNHLGIGYFENIYERVCFQDVLSSGYFGLSITSWYGVTKYLKAKYLSNFWQKYFDICLSNMPISFEAFKYVVKIIDLIDNMGIQRTLLVGMRGLHNMGLQMWNLGLLRFSGFCNTFFWNFV